MAAHGARRLGRMNDNLSVIIGVEALCGSQGIEFRAPLKTSSALQAVIARIREDIPRIEEDRYMANDIDRMAKMVSEGLLLRSAEAMAGGAA